MPFKGLNTINIYYQHISRYLLPVWVLSSQANWITSCAMTDQKETVISRHIFRVVQQSQHGTTSEFRKHWYCSYVLFVKSFWNLHYGERRKHNFWHSEDRATWYILLTKPTRCTNFSNLFMEWNCSSILIPLAGLSETCRVLFQK